MKIIRLVTVCAGAAAITALMLAGGAKFVPGQRGVQASAVSVPAPSAMPLGLPSEQDAKAVLSASLRDHHPMWVDVPMGAASIRTVVLYPDLAGTAPVVVVTAKNQGMTDWLRAVGTQLVTQGLISVVPDLLSGQGPNGGGTDSFGSRAAVAAALSRMSPAEIQRRTDAVRDYFLSQPGANGKSAILDFNWSESRLDAAIKTPALQRVVKLDLSEHAWHNALPLLTNLSEPVVRAQMAAAQPQVPAPSMDKDTLAGAATNQAQAQKIIAERNDFPTQSWGAKRMVENSPRHGQWVDIPVATEKNGTVNMHMFVLQPLGTEKAGVVVVIQPSPGMDLGEEPRKGGGAYWMRSIADQIALQGFIVVMPDLTSGLGPNGGNYDSFVFSDDQFETLAKRPVSERMEFVRAARAYGLKLPRANGKSGTLGFCSGGGLSWQAAAEVPGLNAAVSFYGTPPNPATMAKIQAPVIAFAGDQDPGLAPRVFAAGPDMQKLGKTFEYKIYAGATHAYLYEQHLAQNAAATLDSWPRSMAFLKRYLNGT